MMTHGHAAAAAAADVVVRLRRRIDDRAQAYMFYLDDDKKTEIVVTVAIPEIYAYPGRNGACACRPRLSLGRCGNISLRR